jgi:hypothetical protein
MRDRIDFDVRVEQPSLEHYRRDWVPAREMALAGMWIGAVVADASGQDYWGLRGADDFLVGMTHVVSPITGFKRLDKTFDPDPPHLFPEYSTIDWFEPMEYHDNGTAVKLDYYSGSIERDSGGFHWFDASNRWEMHGVNASDIFVVHVPKQDAIDTEVYYRHELLWATGKINGVEVSGYLHQDYAYGPPGTVYPELPIARQLQGMWVSWLQQYEDGQLGGGCLWQGRDGLTFGPGYQFKDGITTAHDDIVATPTFNDDGKLTTLAVSIGADTYSFAFDTAGSFVHYFGRLTDSLSGKKAARSWCWVEYAGGLLTPEILDFMMQRFRLARGK